MLKGARYWFSQLTLIQALCLLNMSESPRLSSDKHGAKPEAIVQHWLDVAGRERQAVTSELARPLGRTHSSARHPSWPSWP